jgi:hypothetical protein
VVQEECGFQAQASRVYPSNTTLGGHNDDVDVSEVVTVAKNSGLAPGVGIKSNWTCGMD